MPAGIWGSAFTVLLQRVLRERKLPSDAVDEMSNMGDLRDELRTSFRVLSIMPNIPVISVGLQMERSVSVCSDRNIGDHLPSGGGQATLTGRTEIDKPVRCPTSLQQISNFEKGMENSHSELLLSVGPV